MKINMLLAAAAAAVMMSVPVVAQPPLPAPVVTDVDGPMGLGAAILDNAINVAFNGYSIVGINVIERRTDGVIVVQVTTDEGPRLIGFRSSESVIGESPCYRNPKTGKLQGGFWRVVMVGGKVTCTYDPDMYVSQPNYIDPAPVTADVDVLVVDIDTRTTTHAGNNILKNYTITEVQSYEYR